MASDFYTKALTKIGNAQIDFDSDNLILLFLTASHYTPNKATDEFISDIPSNGIVKRSDVLAGVTQEAAIVDATDPTVTSVSGSQIDYVALAKYTGNDATSPLICLWESGTGLPLTPNGGSVQVQFDNGTNKVCNF